MRECGRRGVNSNSLRRQRFLNDIWQQLERGWAERQLRQRHTEIVTSFGQSWVSANPSKDFRLIDSLHAALLSVGQHGEQNALRSTRRQQPDGFDVLRVAV